MGVHEQRTHGSGVIAVGACRAGCREVRDEDLTQDSGGSITVLTPSSAALTIDAETSAGGIRSDLPISRLSADEDSLKGTLNGGGTKLVLRRSAGSIEIVSAEKATAQQ